MNEFEIEASDYGAKLDGMVCENPTRAILFALGAGVALALVARALQPHSAESRAVHLLDDLRERLNGLANSTHQRAKGLASDGASIVENGAARLSNLHLDRGFGRTTAKLRSLFR